MVTNIRFKRDFLFKTWATNEVEWQSVGKPTPLKAIPVATGGKFQHLSKAGDEHLVNLTPQGFGVTEIGFVEGAVKDVDFEIID